MSDTVPLRLLGIGPQRTGSTWLDRQLRRHPELTLPAHVKETFFFDARWPRGLDDYRRHFASGGVPGARAPEAWAEVGPSYFDAPRAPARVAAAAPGAVAVAVLRDPVERAVSLWRHHLRKGRVPPDFWAAARAIPSIVEAGDYARHLGRWRGALGAERVHVLVMEEALADPAAALDAVTAWADLAPLAPAPEAEARVNAAGAPRWPLAAKAAAGAVGALHRARLHRVVAWGKRLGLDAVYSGARGPLPDLAPEDRARLADRYAPHVAHVEALLGREPPWPLA